MSIERVVIIGAGNVGTAMAHAFKRAGIQVQLVYSRTLAHAQALAGSLETVATDRFGDIPVDADLYLVSVKDEAINEVAARLPKVAGLVAHTSGSTPLAQLAMHARPGVFYALQTFTKGAVPDFTHIPFLLESSSEEDARLLSGLASRLSADVRMATTQQRQGLHVAAVFANNFTNHLLAISKALLDEQQLEFELLKPLIEKTVSNALKGEPGAYQTGPAKRNDQNILELHEQFLKNHPLWQKIYALISESIAAMPAKND